MSISLVVLEILSNVLRGAQINIGSAPGYVRQSVRSELKAMGGY